MKKHEKIAQSYIENGHRFYREVFNLGIYNPVKELGQLDVVLDIGACHGSFSLWVYEQAKEIHAIEPWPANYQELQDVCRDLPKIKTHHLSIWNNNGQAFIEGADLGGATTRGQGVEDGREAFEVECKTLNTFLKENNIKKVDVLKTDAESSEHTFFRSDDIKEALSKVNYIIGEHLDGLKDNFEKLGFSYKNYNHGFIVKK